jgi:hypothetical protein
MAMRSGTAIVAPTAGMATPESLTKKPMVSATSRVSRPGRRAGYRSKDRCRARDPHDVSRART